MGSGYIANTAERLISETKAYEAKKKATLKQEPKQDLGELARKKAMSSAGQVFAPGMEKLLGLGPRSESSVQFGLNGFSGLEEARQRTMNPRSLGQGKLEEAKVSDPDYYQQMITSMQGGMNAQPFGTKDYTREQAEASLEKQMANKKMMEGQQRSLQFGGELADRGKQIEMPNRQQNASVSKDSSAQQDEAAQSQAAANFQIDFLERSGAVQTAKLSLPNAETLDAFKEAMVAKMNQQGQKIETQGRGLSNLNGSIHPPARL